jgi:outer membrane protein assembly factor BamB
MRDHFILLFVLLGSGACQAGKDKTSTSDSGRDAKNVSDTVASGVADAGMEPHAVANDSSDGSHPGNDVSTGRDVTFDSAGDSPAHAEPARDGSPADGPGADGREVGQGEAGGKPSQDRVSVLQHHNHASRDGFFVDPALTRAAVAGMHLDPGFPGAITKGPTYAQPLYLAGTGGVADLVLVATEQNHVYAFDASNGKTVWDQVLGTPLPKSRLATLRQGCGNIDPLGVTGTPIIEAATRTLYLDAMTVAKSDGPAEHKVFALDADTGAVKAGWPVDLNSTAVSGSTAFDSLAQNQRGALALLDGKVFIPFGGHIGDCGNYHGWIVGISVTDPTQVSAWATRAIAGGVWAPGGISSDGRSLFFATGNTEAQANDFSAPRTWQDGETIFRLPPSLVWSGADVDRFTPTNWTALDDADTDLGGTAPIVFDLPGASPSALVIGLGKDGNAYILDRNNLGGLSTPTALAQVANGNIINAAAAYTTSQGSYVVFKGNGKGCPSGQSGGLTAFRISAAAPPKVKVAWCGGPGTQDSPAVSVVDSQGNDAVVWIVSSDDTLYGLDGDTGKTIYAGTTPADAMSTVEKFIPPIIANGRVFVAASNQVYAFKPN